MLRVPRKRVRGMLLAAFLVAGAIAAQVPAARADYAVLRSGQRLHITSFQALGSSVRLDLAGGSVIVPAGELVAVEPEDVFPSAARPALSMPYAEQIRTSASAYGVDPELIASVIAVESNFNSHAKSRKTALGLMQLQLATAAGLSVQNIFDPAQNIDAGTRYLKKMLDRYHQNLTMALAAYNAGPDAVDQYRGIPPYSETHNYVRRVMEKFAARRIAAASPQTLLRQP